MAIESRFIVRKKLATDPEYADSDEMPWVVVATNGKNELTLAASREELMALALAARLNEAYTDGFEEVRYLVSVGRSILT